MRVPLSPRWLIAKKGDFENAERILKRTDPEGVEEAVRLALEEKKENKLQVGFMALFNKKYIKITMLAIFIALFNQLSGINAIIYFAPRIFDMAGISAESALLSTVGIGVVNIIATMLGLFLIDRIGRKKLMYIGSIGYIVSLLLIAYSFSGAEINNSFLPIFMFMFIASHAVGQGAVIWVFISEIFPNELRAHGQSMGCFTHWILAAIVANIFPLMANQFGPMVIFGFFALMMVLQFIWVFTKMPETKGRSLEEIQKEFVKNNG